ncbi:MAG: hypothetical protein IJC40_05270 [Muribaculaceae bacterium]|nr:hypothetical protein [Muribaculaceae bacterium]
MRHLFSLISIVFTIAIVGMAQNTTRPNLEPEITTAGQPTEFTDSLIVDSSLISISGYDKPLRATKETFFVSNKYACDITAISITFNYYDMQGRQLHAVTQEITQEIPSGETRQLYIPSWDKQQAFYYYLSPQPRRSATPYKVEYRINYVRLRQHP